MKHLYSFMEEAGNELKAEFEIAKKENRKLQLKVDGLQKQIILIQNSVRKVEKSNDTHDNKEILAEEKGQNNSEELIGISKNIHQNKTSTKSVNIIAESDQNSQGWFFGWGTDTFVVPLPRFLWLQACGFRHFIMISFC